MSVSKEKEQELLIFLKDFSDLFSSFPDILNNYFDEQGLKNEYKNEKYHEIVLINKTIKHNLEILSEANAKIKAEKEDERMVNFQLIVGSEVDNLLKECTDFSILFHTLVSDILLTKIGMNDETLMEDARNMCKKYFMFVEKLEAFKEKLQLFLNCYYD